MRKYKAEDLWLVSSVVFDGFCGISVYGFDEAQLQRICRGNVWQWISYDIPYVNSKNDYIEKEDSISACVFVLDWVPGE